MVVDANAKTDVSLRKVAVLLQKCRDMGLDYSVARGLFELMVEAYADKRYQEAEAMADKAIGLMLNDIKAGRLAIGCYRVRNAADIPCVRLGEGVRLWPLFNGGTNGVIPPEKQSPLEYNGLVGEIQIDGGHILDAYRYGGEEFYYVFSGQGVLSLEDQEMSVRAGDWICIPSNWRHSLKPSSTDFPMRLFVVRAYSDRRTADLLPVGTDPLSLLDPPALYTDSAVAAMGELATKMHEASSLGVGLDASGALFREADYYIEIANACFSKNEPGTRKYAGLAIGIIQRLIEDIKRWDSYRSDITRLKATCATSEGEWLHNASSLDWFIFADKEIMKPEWGRPVTAYTNTLVEWETPPGKALYPHTHNTEEFYYITGSVCGMKIGPTGTNEFNGKEKEFLLHPGDCLFIPANTRHVARSVSNQYPLHSLCLSAYSDEVVSGDAAIY